MKHKVIRVGKHSLAVIIPAKFTHDLGIKAGDEVNVLTNTKTGKVFLTFSGSMQLPLSLSVSGKSKRTGSKKKNKDL